MRMLSSTYLNEGVFLILNDLQTAVSGAQVEGERGCGCAVGRVVAVCRGVCRAQRHWG